MENLKHTKGEWQITPMGHVIHVESGKIICTTQSNFIEDFENAKLIAASSDLLEALLKIVYKRDGEWFIGIEGDTNVTNIVVNAINKATK